VNRALLGDRAQQQVGETTVTAVSNYEEVRVLGTLQELLGGRAFEYHSLHHGVVVLIDAGRIHLTVEQSQRLVSSAEGDHHHRHRHPATLSLFAGAVHSATSARETLNVLLESPIARARRGREPASCAGATSSAQEHLDRFRFQQVTPPLLSLEMAGEHDEVSAGCGVLDGERHGPAGLCDQQS